MSTASLEADLEQWLDITNLELNASIESGSANELMSYVEEWFRNGHAPGNFLRNDHLVEYTSYEVPAHELVPVRLPRVFSFRNSVSAAKFIDRLTKKIRGLELEEDNVIGPSPTLSELASDSGFAGTLRTKLLEGLPEYKLILFSGDDHVEPIMPTLFGDLGPAEPDGMGSFSLECSFFEFGERSGTQNRKDALIRALLQTGLCRFSPRVQSPTVINTVDWIVTTEMRVV